MTDKTTSTMEETRFTKTTLKVHVSTCMCMYSLIHQEYQLGYQLNEDS